MRDDAEPLGRRNVNLKFRDSLTEMDSRFRGNDVIRVRYVTLTTTVIPAIAVIPAKAGIHRLIQRHFESRNLG